MRAICNIVPWARLLLLGSVFLAAMCALVLCIFKYNSRGKARYVAPWGAAFFALVVVLVVSMPQSAGDKTFFGAVPWIFYPVVSGAVISFGIADAAAERKRMLSRLSPDSIKEAFDNLNCGILFSDATGKIILINHQMNTITSPLIGSYPQTLSDILDALSRARDGGVLIDVGQVEGLYRFPDGKVRQIKTVPVRAERLSGFFRTTVHDVTEIYSVSEKLKEENEALSVTNEKLKAMYERLSDRIREEETLKLKMRVHNDIGASLIAISELIKGGDNADMQTQIAVLRNAASYLKSDASLIGEDFDDVRKIAEKMNVTLAVDGALPRFEKARRLVALAARECVTNCVNHAKGTRVLLNITRDGDCVTATFTNDGEKPVGKIIEGGGLSTLRRRVEDGGGKMNVESDPAFSLSLNIPDKEETT